jgi:hypothetical protein
VGHGRISLYSNIEVGVARLGRENHAAANEEAQQKVRSTRFSGRLLESQEVGGARLNEAHVRGGPPLLPDETGETDESVLDKYRLAFPPQ